MVRRYRASVLRLESNDSGGRVIGRTFFVNRRSRNIEFAQAGRIDDPLQVDATAAKETFTKCAPFDEVHVLFAGHGVGYWYLHEALARQCREPTQMRERKHRIAQIL